MEQSLYHWLSKSPPSTAVSSPLKVNLAIDQADLLSDNNDEEDLSSGIYKKFYIFSMFSFFS